MSTGAVQIANDGRCCKVTKRMQGLVYLASGNTLQALTSDPSIYFQKLWLYPAKAISAGNLLTPNTGAVYVGDLAQQYASLTLTSCQIIAAPDTDARSLLVTCVYGNHGFASNDVVTIAGAADAAFNGKFTVTRVDANTFTYMVAAPPLTNVATGTVTASGWQAAPTASRVTPDALQPTDLPLKYELPLGQSQPLSSVLVQSASAGDGVFYRLWA